MRVCDTVNAVEGIAPAIKRSRGKGRQLATSTHAVEIRADNFRITGISNEVRSSNELAESWSFCWLFSSEILWHKSGPIPEIPEQMY